MEVTGGLVAFMFERPAYSITLEDHGDRVAWRLERDDEKVAGGTVEVPNEPLVAGASIEVKLNYAFVIAWAQAHAKRNELFHHDLEDTIRVAEEERAEQGRVDALVEWKDDAR